MTVARELKLEKEDGHYRITSLPVDELKDYRSKTYQKDDLKIQDDITLFSSKELDLSKAEIRFQVADLKEANYRFRLSNSRGEKLDFGYDHREKEFFIDRSESGITNFSPDFAQKVSKAPRISEGDELDGIIILDKTSIELFFDDGKSVFTEIFFPEYPWESLSVISGDKEFTLDHIESYELNFTDAQVNNQTNNNSN